MTVESTTRRAGPYLGNGVTTSFPFDFKVFGTSDIALTVTDADGIATALVPDTDYSITLNPDQDSDPGGSITYPLSGDPLATGETLVGVGNIPYDQTTDLPSGGPYRAATVESAFDRTVFQIQQLAEAQGRSLALPPSAATADTELPAPVALNVIGWNETADGLVNYTPADLATVVVAGTSYFDVFNGDGAQTQFVLTANPGSVNALDVALDGVPQKNGIDFTASGTTLTFVSAPGVGTQNIAVRYVAAVPVGSANAQDVTFLQAGTGATIRTAQDKLREMVSLADFGADSTGTAYSDTAMDNALASGAGTILIGEGTFKFANTHKVPSYTRIEGRGLKTILIKDTTNTVNVTDPTSGVTTNNVNCLFYADPAYVANPDDPSGVDAACHIELLRLRYRYTGAFAANCCFFFTTQLGRSRFSELYANGCDWLGWALILYTTDIERCLFRGWRIDTGTSLVIRDSGAAKQIVGGNTYRWKLNNIVYSTLQGCYGESGVSAFRLDNCSLTMIGCGCEVMTPTGTLGQFVDFGDNNNVTVIDPTPFVKASTGTGAIIALNGINNSIRIQGGIWNNNPGQAAVYDIYIGAGGNTVWCDGVTWYSGATPIINCNGALGRDSANVFVRNGKTLTRYTTNSVSSPLLASTQTVMDAATANLIQSKQTSGGGTFDAVADVWQANGSDVFAVKKLGTAGGSALSGSANGGVDLLLDSGSGDVVLGTLGSGRTRFVGGNRQSMYLDSTGLVILPPGAQTPANNGELTIQASSNTQLTLKYKGSDGTVRSVNLTLT